ncbi:hypothetical protein [Tsukamurella strandjordii]|uniref:Uncharacterized protein n=1 Tax=Tsukamurella strandjordii TaxID=147577 RepID=A0AA90NME1_9ACTN|nr:hypothetical protein [Tsukamurella strandjordii]MDP0400364.1 hypothetical protein [Tsukamurella strandjordii]
MSGGEVSSGGPRPMVVRLGYRPAGIALVLLFGLIGVLMLSTAALVMSEGVDSVSALVLFAFAAIAGIAMSGLTVFILVGMYSGREVAVLSSEGVSFTRVEDPALRRWRWSEVTSVGHTIEAAGAYQQAVVYTFGLPPGRRSRAMMYSVASATVSDRFWFRDYQIAAIRITPFHTPSPRAVGRYIYSVAPDKGLELIPPRHRPKNYPWRDISGDAGA